MEEQLARVTSIFELVLCLSQAIDLVSPLVADHHKRTAMVAYGLGRQMRLPENELMDLIIAATLHDVGSLTRHDRLSTLDFEFQDPYGHAARSYLLLASFAPFQNSAEITRFHHVPWGYGNGTMLDGLSVPLNSHLLQLADRLAVLIDPKIDVFEQVDSILNIIRANKGARFHPDQVDALEELADKEVFWLDSVYLLELNYLDRRLKWPQLEINEVGFLGLVNLFRRIIDFRSPFTASHSAGVAATATSLAKLCGFSKTDCWMVHLAGLLHDLGKLAVPAEILEKPAALTREEFDVIRRHTYYTFHILEPLKILDIVRIWGAFHHERMDGHGYPFHLEENELPLGSRIVSVADIFTALTEDRPYRNALPVEEAIHILSVASERHRLDSQVVATLKEHLTEIDGARREAQKSSIQEYNQFIEDVKLITHIE